jgi:hypothetical protein
MTLCKPAYVWRGCHAAACRVPFGPAAAAVGLDGLVPHELRHTAASPAVPSGADVKAVKRYSDAPGRP